MGNLLRCISPFRRKTDLPERPDDVLFREILLKSILGVDERNFLRAADTFRVQRCEGPRPFSEKRSRTGVLALRRASTAEVSKNQHLRDFWRRTIFDFFNSIRKPEVAFRGREDRF